MYGSGARNGLPVDVPKRRRGGVTFDVPTMTNANDDEVVLFPWWVYSNSKSAT
jgi:uncharacterized protein YbaA (DUF1428 family)